MTERCRHRRFGKRLIAVAAAMILLLTACGSGGDAPAAPSQGAGTAAQQGAAGETGDAGQQASGQETGQQEAQDPADKAQEAIQAGTDTDAGTGADSGSQAQLFPASGPEILTAGKYYYEWDDEMELLLIKGTVESPILSASSAQAYPALEMTLRELRAKTEAEADEFTSEMLETARIESREIPEYFSEYTYDGDVLVRRSDERVLSFATVYAGSMGGAHGFTEYETATLDVNTGKRLHWSEVFTVDGAELMGLIRAKVLEVYPQFEYDAEWMDTQLNRLFLEEPESDEVKWTLDPQGVTFWFAPYDLGAYAAGSPVITFRYDELAGKIGDAYLPVPGRGYFCGVAADYYTEMFDLDGDGLWDEFFFDRTFEPDWPDDYTGLTLNVRYGADGPVDPDSVYDGTAYRECAVEDLYYTGLEVYYVQTADDQRYLYVWIDGINDSSWLYVFRAKGGDPALLGSEDVTFSYEVVNEDTWDGGAFTPTDPNHLPLHSRFDMLSTFSAGRHYSVGRDGLLTSADVFYELSPDTSKNLVLTSVQDLTTDIVDEAGQITEKDHTFPAGETFSIIRTDGDKFIDCLTSDGSIARLYVTYRGWPQEVNGLPAEEVFEMLYYAG
ncbi:MAG: DUF3298 and DUF4163 domain-containing protein [Lachnospiraceae bacterium]|nr:DUF3298 and DUF4163 domain-containing protein [Lachnospiraceae bacterium]